MPKVVMIASTPQRGCYSGPTGRCRTAQATGG
jgi:hypothetical protein